MTTDRAEHLGDFTLSPRVLLITAIAIPVGVAATGAAYCLLKLIGLITNLVFYDRVGTQLLAPGSAHPPAWLVLGAPIAAGLIVGVMARFGSEKIRGHGMPEAIEAILTGGSRVAPRVAVLKPISAALTIGSGGPFGAEGPIIMTGGAVGSLLAQLLRLSADERKTLLVAGATGGMAATFNAPLASMLLAVELLLFEWRPRSIIPVGTSVLVATVCRSWVLGSGAIFPVHSVVHAGAEATGLALVPGITGGILAVLATALVYFAEDTFQKLPVHWMWWPAIGGAIIGLGGLIEPHALGVGYDVIDQLLTGNAGLSLIIGILLVKTAIWSLSLGSGTSGGVLAPVFMIGGALGALEGHLLPGVFPGFWAMAGLAAVVGGVMRSPFTGVVFTLELTHAWNNLVPLLVSSLAAYLVSVLALKRSVLTEKIARRGLHLTREYSTDPLEVFFAREVMSHDPPIVSRMDLVTDVLADRLITGDRRGDPPLLLVLDEHRRLCGVVSRHALLESFPGQTIGAIATPARALVHPDNTLREVANVLAEHSITQAPVVDRADPSRLHGLITLEQLLHARRQDLHEERHRERLLLVPSREEEPAGTLS